MKPVIKEMNLFVKIITFGWAGAICIAPFGIYIGKKYWDTWYFSKTVRHESIHWMQQMEMLIIPFYIWYLVEWLIRIITPPWKTSYKDISFEREAYDNEKKIGYLDNRKHYVWTKYIIKNG